MNHLPNVMTVNPHPKCYSSNDNTQMRVCSKQRSMLCFTISSVQLMNMSTRLNLGRSGASCGSVNELPSEVLKKGKYLRSLYSLCSTR